MTAGDIERGAAISVSKFWNVTRSQLYRELRGSQQCRVGEGRGGASGWILVAGEAVAGVVRDGGETDVSVAGIAEEAVVLKLVVEADVAERLVVADPHRRWDEDAALAVGDPCLRVGEIDDQLTPRAVVVHVVVVERAVRRPRENQAGPDGAAAGEAGDAVAGDVRIVVVVDVVVHPHRAGLGPGRAGLWFRRVGGAEPDLR